MRKVIVNSCLALSVCACLIASLAAGAPRQLTGSSRFQPGSGEVTARLTRQIDPLVVLFPAASKVPTDTLIDSLLESDVARRQLFRLESLLRLYRHKFPNVAVHLRQVKAVEDGLGAYMYAVDSLTFAKDKFKKENRTQGPSAAQQAEQEQILEGLQKKEVMARAVLVKLLERSTLSSDLPQFRSQASSRFRGWGSAKDVPYVKKHLQRMLKNVRDGKYDFTKLEDGIHEFRRQLRWFPLTIDALDGLVLVRDDAPGACPRPALEALAGSAAARNRYANPSQRFPAAHPCTISRCLLWQVSKAVRDLGHLKDEAQGNAAVEAALDDDVDVSTSNHATPEETARAKAIRDELNSSRALDSLMSQISSCRP